MKHESEDHKISSVSIIFIFIDDDDDVYLYASTQTLVNDAILSLGIQFRP